MTSNMLPTSDPLQPCCSTRGCDQAASRRHLDAAESGVLDQLNWNLHLNKISCDSYARYSRLHKSPPFWSHFIPSPGLSVTIHSLISL